jgi:predicted dehydrogenase
MILHHAWNVRLDQRVAAANARLEKAGLKLQTKVIYPAPTIPDEQNAAFQYAKAERNLYKINPTLNHLVNWRLYRAYGHGLMTENGTHQMDAAGWLLGNRRPQRVSGMGVTRFDDQRETHDVVAADYEFDGRTIVRYTQDLHQGTNYRWNYGELFMGKEGALRIGAEQELVLIDKDRRETRVSIERLGDFELAGLSTASDELKKAEADRAGGGLRSFSYQNEMRIFANCVRTRQQPACTAEIGHNSIVSTIIGTEAQYNNEPRAFQADMFV